MIDLSNENIIHVKKKDIEYIQFKKLLEYPNVEHCYTLRKNDLNFKVYTDDHILQKSSSKICDALQWNKENMIRPHQTHTDKVEKVENRTQDFNEVDGLVTNKKNMILCTNSADCTSLLFYDPIKQVIGDVHSGWRGTIQRIGQKAVLKMMKEYGCEPKNIICCICPHIRKCHFEVEEDVAKMFEEKFIDMEQRERFIKIGRKINHIQKYNIDTTLINVEMLKRLGLLEKNIIDSGICTVCEKDKFHSYRADKELSGRNVAMILLKNAIE